MLVGRLAISFFFKGCLPFFLDPVLAWSRPFLSYLCNFCWDRIVEKQNSQHQSPAYCMTRYDFHPSDMIFIGTWVGHLRTRVWRCPSSTWVPAILSACVKRYGRRFLSWVLDKGPYWRSVPPAGRRWWWWKEGKGSIWWVMVVNTFQHECLVHRCWQTIWVRKLFECTQLHALGPRLAAYSTRRNLTH